MIKINSIVDSQGVSYTTIQQKFYYFQIALVYDWIYTNSYAVYHDRINFFL